jgi:hypothetical protein
MEIILSNIPGHVPLIVRAFNSVSQLIFYFNFFIWFLPPFRQYKGGFFLFFLILALTDPAGFLLFKIFKIEPIYSYAPSSLFLLFAALFYTDSLKPGIILFNSFVSLVSAVLFIIFHDVRLLIILMAYLQFVILFNFIIYLVRKLFYRNIFYSYLLVLVLYEFTIIIKSILFIFQINTTLFLIHFLNLFEIIICFYFIIFNLKTGPRFRPQKRDSLLSL